MIVLASLTDNHRFDAPPAHYITVLEGALSFRKLVLRYLVLPRPDFMRKLYIPPHPDAKSGRFNSVEYLSHPWYVRPSFTRRWGIRAWVTRLLGRKLPGDDGNKYAPEGYTFEDIGPSTAKGKGSAEMDDTKKWLENQHRGGCPFGSM